MKIEGSNAYKKGVIVVDFFDLRVFAVGGDLGAILKLKSRAFVLVWAVGSGLSALSPCRVLMVRLCESCPPIRTNDNSF